MKKVKENINSSSRHPRELLSGVSLIGYLEKGKTLFTTAEQAEDSRQRTSGMTTLFNVRAFTLIELLVVVLIIGILAAIALPQYQKAVMKARIAQVLPIIRAVADAQQIYYLANGAYADTLDDLGVSFQCPTGWVCSMNSGGLPKIEIDYGSLQNSLGVIYYYGQNPEHPILHHQLYCWAKKSDSQAVNVCKTFGPEIDIEDESNPYIRYEIQ